MTTKTDAIAIDPRRFQDPEADALRNNTYRQAPWLPDSSPEERSALTAHVIRDLIAHPQTTRHPRSGKLLINPDPTWHRIRDLVVLRDGSKVVTVDQLLARDHSNHPYHHLTWLITWLLGARERRLELAKQIEMLEAIERAFGAALDNPARLEGTGQLGATAAVR